MQAGIKCLCDHTGKGIGGTKELGCSDSNEERLARSCYIFGGLRWQMGRPDEGRGHERKEKEYQKHLF